ncbi:NACHT domain-containing protein [Actinomadura sp. 1N219]|uniref:NACHT domain-containing protein n=1 Tax=Actinomadura sp. 1N219 TaxID=3375152 RepID=UPI003787A631
MLFLTARGHFTVGELIKAAGLVVAVASFVVSAIALLLQRYTAGGGDDAAVLDRAAERLARLVRQQWVDEVATRRLYPAPIRVRWSSTGRPVAASASVVMGEESSDDRSRRLAFQGDVSQIVELMDRLPAHQLVIIGSPGSGKTVLAVLYTLARLERLGPGDPVPVVLAMSSWNPSREHLHTWLSRRIAEDYPMLMDEFAYGRDAAIELVRSGRVLPVLDGLDEMSAGLVPTALDALNNALTDGHGIVLTCRSGEYEDAVTATATPLARAAVIETEPVPAQNAIAFLTAMSIDGGARWGRLVDRLRTSPLDPVSKAMSTPLAISLARSVYASPERDPAELCDAHRFPDAETIERYLLAQYVAAVYVPRPPPPGCYRRTSRYRLKAVETWLGTLTHLLEHRLTCTSFAWWHLGRTIPITVLGLISGVLGLLSWLVLAGPLGLLIELSPGIVVVVGLSAVRAAYAQPDVVDARRIGGLPLQAVRDAFGTLIATAPFAAATVPSPIDLWSVEEFLHSLLISAAFAGVLSLTVGAMTLGQDGGPRQFSVRLNRLGKPLAEGLFFGLLAGLAVGMVVRLFYGSEPGAENLAMISFISITLGMAIPVTLSRWLRTPVDRDQPLHPRSVLCADRRITLAVGAAVGTSAALCMAFVFVALHVVDQGNPFDLSDALSGTYIFLVLFAVAVAAIAVVTSGSAWVSYSIARCWLALWRRLPWRVMYFLEDAHARGVLRRDGTHYQLRHVRLQESLAEQHSENLNCSPLTGLLVNSSGSWPPSWYGGRLGTTAMTVISCLGLLAITLTLLALRDMQ